MTGQQDSVVGVGVGSDQLRWMKKLVLAFNIAAVAGLMPSVLTDVPVHTQFSSCAIVVSFAAFFASTLLHNFHRTMSRISDCVGVFSGTLAFGWLLSIAIKGRFKWFAFLPCVFSSFLLAFELYQLVVVAGMQPASEAIQTLAIFPAEVDGISGDQRSYNVTVAENQQEEYEMCDLIGSPS